VASEVLSVVLQDCRGPDSQAGRRVYEIFGCSIKRFIPVLIRL
jgi:hypothetical protein